MSIGIFEPVFVKNTHDIDGLHKHLDEYEKELNIHAATLKNLGKTVTDQDFECCSFSLENSGDTHLILLGGMGPMAGVHGIRDALKTCRKGSSITLFQACGMPKRTAGADITQMLQIAVKNALKYSPKKKNTKLIVLCNGAHSFMKDVLKDEEIGDRVEFCSLKHSVEKHAKIFEDKKSIALQTHFSAQNCIYGYTHALRSLHEVPELASLQADLCSAIEGVKSFDERKVIQNAVNVFDALKKWGAQKLLLGCTELPVIVEHMRRSADECMDGIELVNPLQLALSEINSGGHFD